MVVQVKLGTVLGGAVLGGRRYWEGGGIGRGSIRRGGIGREAVLGGTVLGGAVLGGVAQYWEGRLKLADVVTLYTTLGQMIFKIVDLVR